MANIPILDANAASQDVATDEIAGVDYQIVKPAFGGAGTATAITPSVGMPVQMVGGTAVATQGTTPWVTSGTVVNGGGTVAMLSAGTVTATVTSGTVHIDNTSITVVTSGTTDVNNTSHLNNSGNLLASAGRTAAGTSSDVTNLYCRGVSMYIDVTAAPAATSEYLSIGFQEKDPNSGKYAKVPNSFGTILASDAGTAAGANSMPYVYKVGPGLTDGTARLGVQVPRTWRLVVTPSGVSSWTYSAGYSHS